MKNFEAITRTNKTVVANIFRKGEFYHKLTDLAGVYEGEIGKSDKGLFKATFKTVKNAKLFEQDFNAWFDTDKANIQAPTQAKGKTPTFEEGKTYTFKNGKFVPVETQNNKKNAPAKSGKKTAKKPTLNDFIKANPLCTREQAVAHGFTGTKLELKALKAKICK